MEKRTPAQEAKSFIPAVFASIFFSFSLFIYGPLDMYAHNVQDLWFGLSELWWGLFLAAICIFLGSMLVFFLLRLVHVRLYRGGLALYLGIALAAYLQGNFFNINAASLEGESVAWVTRLWPTLINAALWAGILLIPVIILCFASKRFGIFVKALSIGLTLMQLVSIVTTLMSIPLNKENIYMSREDRFELSQQENIIVLIADSVGTDFMDELIQKSPEKLAFLDGFTYYPNTVGAYRKTAGTYAYLLSGEYYLNKQSFFNYCKEAFSKDTFWKELKSLGYNIHIGESGSAVPYIPEQMEVFDNLVNQRMEVSSHVALVKQMLKMTGYRFSPDVLKPFLLQDFLPGFNSLKAVPKGQSPMTYKNDAYFYQGLCKEKLTVQPDQKAFRLYFLEGTHEPFRMNAKAEAVEKNSFDHYQTLLGVFHIFDEYLTQLKELGLYENSTIIIMADHALTNTLSPKNPLFMVKPKGSSGEMTTSLAPISYEDFRPTIMQAAGGDFSKYGTPVDTWKEGDARERKYYVYSWTKIQAYEYYFSDIHELVANGDVRDLNVYKPTGISYTKDGVKKGD